MTFRTGVWEGYATGRDGYSTGIDASIFGVVVGWILRFSVRYGVFIMGVVVVTCLALSIGFCDSDMVSSFCLIKSSYFCW